MLPVLKRKMAEWEAKRKAKPLIQRWLHMMVRRGQYRRLQQKAIWWQARRRGTLARRRVSAMVEAAGGRKALRARCRGIAYGMPSGVHVVPGGGGGGGGGGALGDEEAEPQTAEERELAQEIERMKSGAAPTLGEGREGARWRGVLDLMGAEEEKLLMAESEMEVRCTPDAHQMHELRLHPLAAPRTPCRGHTPLP